MFINNYNTWVIGLSAVVNYKGIQAIISRAINWEKWSGTIFKGEKTILVYFIKNMDWTSINPFIIKRKTVVLEYIVKILGVVIDIKL